MVSTELLVLNFLLGLLATFSPCLFPLLPSYVAISVRSHQSNKITIISSLFVVLGILLVFFSLGLISSNIGTFLLTKYSTFAKIQAFLLILAGLFMIRTPSIFYKLRPPQFVERRLFGDKESSNPFVMNFIVGLSYTIIAAPCASGIFLFAWSNLLDKSIIDQFLMILVFSIGAGLPFLVMALYVPRLRGNQVNSLYAAREKISIILGLILILIGILLYNDVGRLSFQSLS